MQLLPAAKGGVADRPKSRCDLGIRRHIRGLALRAALDGLDALVEKSPFAHWAPLEVGLYCLESLRAQEFQERLLLNANDLEVSHDRQLALELARVEAELGKLQSVPPIVTVGTSTLWLGADQTIVEAL